LEIPECGGQQVAQAPTPEPVTRQAPIETPRPLETLTLDARTLFEFDKATLQPAARGKLDELAQRMNSQADVLFVNVTGHADRIGSSEYNEQLSKQRAAAVADYLQNNTDLRTAKFQVTGAGESKPVVECEGSETGKALIDCLEPNRRVEVEVSLTQPAQSDTE
jgi:OOP family OmpA-OmpF porin